jgi:hypothetical protein
MSKRDSISTLVDSIVMSGRDTSATKIRYLMKLDFLNTWIIYET